MSNTALPPQTDEQLIAQYKQGDNAALVELVARYIDLSDKKIGRYPHLLREAEDVKQEALITLLQAVSRYDPARGASFKTYVNLCTDHTISNFLLHVSAKKIRLLSEAIPLEDVQKELLDHDNPEQRLIDRERYEQVEQAIQQRLSDFEREVLFYILEGKRYAEVALLLCCSEKAVDNALQRLRKKLEDCK